MWYAVEGLGQVHSYRAYMIILIKELPLAVQIHISEAENEKNVMLSDVIGRFNPVKKRYIFF